MFFQSSKSLKTISVLFFSGILVGNFCLPVIATNSNSGNNGANLNNSQDFAKKAAEGAGFQTAQNLEPEPIIGQVIKVFLSFLGVIFFLLVIYGGFLWMTAGGNTDQVAKARKIIINATIGLAIVLFAYAITWFVVDTLTGSTGYNAGG